LLSIRNFAVVETLDVEFEPGFSVLTGETGAGKSILLDALALLLGGRFEMRQLRPGADRAELSAEFDLADAQPARAWLVEQDLGDDGPLLLRRTLDAQGRSRAWINGRPATLAQLAAAGEALVDLHGQHDHESLVRPETQRALVDAFGGFTTLAREVASGWRAWRDAAERRLRSERDAAAIDAERDQLAARQAELAALGTSEAEWRELAAAQSRLSHAERLLEAAASGEAELIEGEAALDSRLAALVQRLRQALAHDPSLGEVVALLDEARIRVDEAGHALRAYRERLDLDPAELERIDERLAAIHAVARKHRVPPEGLPALAADTEARLALLSETGDREALARAETRALATYRALATQLGAKRRLAAMELAHRVTAAMNELAMGGGRFEVAVSPLAEPASFGMETVEFRVAAHAKQPLGPLASVASGGELSRIALALQVVLADIGEIPTLAFDEVDVGIGGAVAATVGRLLRQLGMKWQVLCVTHLPQVAACADGQYRVMKRGRADSVATALVRLDPAARVEELARMLGGDEITAKARAHARELLAQQRKRTRSG
ncbi:MAG TPA: DNA repair protein RecN, partial [Casimicrobiaceae bacterium]|nr:DNA repair protein RecN [Casimicrobiaceae bacterium]